MQYDRVAYQGIVVCSFMLLFMGIRTGIFNFCVDGDLFKNIFWAARIFWDCKTISFFGGYYLLRNNGIDKK